MTEKPSTRYDPKAIRRNSQGQPSHVENSFDGDEFDALLERDFPREAAVRKQFGMDRRTFMKLMGGSLALAGFGAAGCTARPSEEEIIPYVRVPEEVIPGKPLFFASAMTLGGFATGVLIETHEGRPTRLDGNPEHPASLGGSNPFLQGSILELYNPDRSVEVRRNRSPETWDAFLEALEPVVSDNDGSGLRILTETVTSPTLAHQLEQLMEAFPGAKWYQYEPVSRDNLIQGSRLAFDEVVNTIYRFSEAEVILSLDADFLYNMPGSLRYAREFSERRKVEGGPEGASQNRLYVVESTPTITGATADHRLALKPSDVELFTRALATALGVDVGATTAPPWDTVWFETLVADLQDNAGACVVVPGFEQPPIVHALAHAINAQLNNVGTTVVYTAPVEANPVIQAEQLAELVDEINNRDVESLFIIGGDPIFTAPVDITLADALEDVPFSVHLSLYDNETSRRCEWHLPQTHFIEEWSDARAFDGTANVVQPPIGPLYETAHSVHELLAVIMGDDRSAYEIVKEYWQSQYAGDDFDAFWRRTVHNGVAEDSAAEQVQPSLRGDFVDQVAATEAPQPGGGVELVFRPDPKIWDGRFANNPWLHELPNPITKLTWDNAALLSRDTADELEVENEDLITLALGDREMTLPVWVTPGHANDTVTVFLGYGLGQSADLDDDRSFNAYAIRTAANPWLGQGVEVDAKDEQYPLASVRGRVDLDDLGPAYGDLPVKYATLTEFLENPDFVHEGEKRLPLASILPESEWDYSDGYSWGMVIDLTACIGCNACVIACQAENNIPTVGKDGVRKAREMHWLRVDRYYDEAGEQDVLKTYFQPVPCMHCETAPCELVCPVEATVHDTEGLNTMIYNRCIGTRYCQANCPYTVRRFNYMRYVEDDAVLEDLRNPDVSVRPEGVMEKCTYCTQRINATRINANNEDRTIRDDEVQLLTACAAACPTRAITFGNLNDPNARVVELKGQAQHYGLLEELGTKPRTTYLARLSNPNAALFTPEEEE